MDSSDEEDRAEPMVEATPRRPSAASRASRTPRSGSRTPASSSTAAIPPTPFNDGNAMVPATPAVRSTAAGSLTPLSGMEDNNDDDDESMGEAGNANNQSRANNFDDDDIELSSDEEGEAGHAASQANRDDENEEEEQQEDDEDFNLGQENQPLVRGTNINIPTAAKAFTHFLRNFRSLARARRAANADDGAESDSDDSISSSNDDSREPPMYLERLKSLLTQGAIHDGAQNGTTSPSTSSLDIDTMHIYYHNESCQRFYQQLEDYPMELVPLMDLLVRKELERLAAAMATENDWDEAPYIPNVQVRPFNLRRISNIRCLDPVAMDSLVSIKGMIVRVSPIIPDLKVAHFTCTICGNDVQVTIDRGRIREPNGKCPRCNTSNSYQLIHNRSIFANKQLVRLQETPDEVPAGQTPASVVTFCFDDLVDCVKPGDRVEVTGVLRAQPMKVHPKLSKIKSIYKTYVDVIHFKRITGMESVRNRDKERVGREGAGMVSRFTPERIQELRSFSQRPDIYEVLVQIGRASCRER